MKSKEGVLLIGVINNIILLYGKEIYNKGEKMLGEKGREERYHSGGWMTEGVEINEGVLIKIIIIVLAYKIIWGIVGESRKGISERILMGINMIGAIVIIGGVSKEIMILYLGLEIYSFTTYILLTTPMGGGGMETRKMSIQYLFYNSFSSALLLIAIYLRYNEMGGLTPLGLSEPEG